LDSGFPEKKGTKTAEGTEGDKEGDLQEGGPAGNGQHRERTRVMGGLNIFCKKELVHGEKCK